MYTIRLLPIGFWVLWAAQLSGQELEPRAYSPAPIGTKFVLAGFGGSKGEILLDPSVDVENVQADLFVNCPRHRPRVFRDSLNDHAFKWRNRRMERQR